MPLEVHGFCLIKNIKSDRYIGRSPVEDKSLLPKSFTPLETNQVKGNAIFEYNMGINPTLREFHSLKSGVAKAEVLPNGTRVLRPAAILEHYVEPFEWETGPDTDRTIIRDLRSGKVWTLPGIPDELGLLLVVLEDYREGDERQLWKIENIDTK